MGLHQRVGHLALATQRSLEAIHIGQHLGHRRVQRGGEGLVKILDARQVQDQE